MPSKLKILIVDDHAIVRDGLTAILRFQKDMTVVGEAEDGGMAVEQVKALNPDVVIMDLMMPNMNGADATAAIKQTLPETQILLLTSYGTSAELSRAFRNGATGAITKSLPKEELLAAIRNVAAGQRVLSPEIEHALGTAAEPPLLSMRQLEVLNLAAKGFTNREIGEILGIGVNGVKAHLKVIYTRLGAASRTEATSLAINLRLISV